MDKNKTGKAVPLKKWAALAACICLILASATVVIAEVFDIGFMKIFDSRDDITKLESEYGLNAKQINRDTKYPENELTFESIVENYTKTSSATFDPKQSDMHFYYSPDCGVVVFSEATTDEPNVEELNKLIISGKDAKGKILDETTRWINLTTGAFSVSTPRGNIIYFDKVYFTEEYDASGTIVIETIFHEDGSGIQKMIYPDGTIDESPIPAGYATYQEGAVILNGSVTVTISDNGKTLTAPDGVIHKLR